MREFPTAHFFDRYILPTSVVKPHISATHGNWPCMRHCLAICIQSHKGKSLKDISHELNLSYFTVKNHLAEARKKLRELIGPDVLYIFAIGGIESLLYWV